MLDRCRADIERLWGDEAVQAELQDKRLRLEESSGLSVSCSFPCDWQKALIDVGGLGDAAHSYLDSLSRITSLRYVPSDDDVLKARLKTIGVVEHTFSLETGKERGIDWKIYDVGGYVCIRSVWKLMLILCCDFLVHEVKYV